ncbi:MAG: exonuclease domain-containing protein [Corynebacterium sp.]|nr:exonuclease domain-containing protein [Corynebacterium sp.]
MKSYVAIDFETANHHPASACAVALARFDGNGQLVDTYSTLLRPDPAVGEFHDINISIHHIRPADVVDAPTWATAYPTITAFIGDSDLVAHNAGFDHRVFVTLNQFYGIPPLATPWLCTLKLSRQFLGFLPRRNLDKVFAHFYPGETFHHHDAHDDAVACGRILAAFDKELGDEKLRTYGTAYTAQGSYNYAPGEEQRARDARARGKKFSAKKNPKVQIKSISRGEGLPFMGSTPGKETPIGKVQTAAVHAKRIALAGNFTNMPRHQLEQLLDANGAHLQPRPTQATDILVCGTGTSDVEAARLKAEKYKQLGFTIIIMQEEDFWSLLLEG